MAARRSIAATVRRKISRDASQNLTGCFPKSRAQSSGNLKLWVSLQRLYRPKQKTAFLGRFVFWHSFLHKPFVKFLFDESLQFAFTMLSRLSSVLCDFEAHP